MSQNLVKLRCEDCGGTMMIDEGREVLSCPYCGSKKVIIESDEVKIEKIKSKNVEMHETNETKREAIRLLGNKEFLAPLLIFGSMALVFLVCIIMFILTSIFD